MVDDDECKLMILLLGVAIESKNNNISKKANKIMENTFKKRFCIDGWWNFEYKVKDMVLTDNHSVYVTDVPDDKIEDTLFMVEMLYGKYGSILGDYNSLKKIFNEDLYEVY